MEKATFAAGCFWGVEAAFRQLEGVGATAVGYMGGSFENPTYEDVCTGTTGHAEVVDVEFDESLISYDQLLDVFWKNHDPTTINRQGPDVGTQYRSAIFFHNASQEAAATASKEKQQQQLPAGKTIVTDVAPVAVFTRAEEYHQQYLEKRGAANCRLP